MKTIKVAAAIIVNGGKLFATQRGYGAFKDGWEFPGGKIEYDYPDFHLSMNCFACTVRSGDLVLREHKSARWLGKDDLYSVDWLPADIGILDRCAKLLERSESI